MKKIVALLLTAGACLSLLACGAKSQKQPSAEEVVKSVSSELVFKDTMTAVAPDRIVNFYRIDETKVDSLAVYMSGSGATAEEVSVIKMKDAKDIQLAKDAMTERVTNQKQSFENYIPGEIPKLEAAVIYTKGSYAILAAADDVSGVEQTFNAQFE